MRATWVILAVASAGCAQREKDVSAAAQEWEAAKAALFSGKAFEGRDGMKEAQDDIVRGNPKLYRYGRMSADASHFSAICKDRFGIVVDPLAGCIVSEPLVKFASAYNEEIERFVAEKHGGTALEEARKEALARWSASLTRKNG